jgi:3'-phosphoadenosine 5'-phosphosulfate sulfotransferase (PAPS reductase)/FAD synthetase
MKKFISFSGGVESTAMCLLYGKGATAIFCDTGAEHEKMYERLNYVENILKDYHNGDFEMIRIKPNHKYKGVYYDNLETFIKESKYFPSARQRFCTGNFKIKPIDDYLASFKEVELLIGLNSDETNRQGNHLKGENITYKYPLIDDNYDRDFCIDLLKDYNLHPNFPPYMNRGGCKFCFYKSKKEYRAMVHLAPNEIEEVAKLEESIQDKRGKFYRIKNDLPKMRTFIEIEKNNLFGDNSKYYESDNDDSPSCGVFCHR